MVRWLLLFLLSCRMGFASLQDLSIAAKGVVLMNAETGVVLFESEGYTPAFPASVTKVATALYALHLEGEESTRLMIASRDAVASITPEAKRQSNYRCPAYWLETDGVHISLKPGETLPLSELLRAILIASANDASNVVAENLGGSVPKFMEGLNAYLQELGCEQTHFCNPHGLHHPEHTTTPYDMALVTREALRCSTFCSIVSMPRYTLPKSNLTYERHLLQTNRLLRRGEYFYPFAIGVKTGYTSKAGRNLIAAARKDGRTLIAVLFGCASNSERYQGVKNLFEEAFAEKKMRCQLSQRGLQPFRCKVKGGRGELETLLPDGLFYEYYPSEKQEVRPYLKWKELTLPIEKGDVVGEVGVVSHNGHLLQRLPLFAAKDLKPTIWTRCKKLIGRKTWFRLGYFGAGGFLVLFLLTRRRRRS